MRRRSQLILILRAGIPSPDEFACMDVKPAYDARRLVRRVIVDHCSADHQDFVSHYWGRSRFIEARGLDAHAFLEVQHAMIGEAVAELTRIGIERDHPAVVDREK